jgi:uncharacterized protein
MTQSSTEKPAFNPIPLVAQETNIPEKGVAAVIDLLAQGGTVPFIARYRKEATGSLDEVQIRTIQERQAYLLELEDRRQTILDSIEQQGKLTKELRARIDGCSTKSALEDLYLPYKPKRRTRATIAREKGLEPLAERILAQPADGDPAKEAQAFVDEEKGVGDIAAALQGARDIVAEVVTSDADIRAAARDVMRSKSQLVSEPVPEKTKEPTKFEQYYDFREAVATIPSHRFLAVRRGEREGVLRVRLEVDPELTLPQMRVRFGLNEGTPFAEQLEQALQDGYSRLLEPSVGTDIRVELKQQADEQAVDVFASNLRNLLMAAPLGQKPVLGIDPGLRTGCKCVAISPTGKFLVNTTIYLSKGDDAKGRARRELVDLIKKHQPGAIAVGNGTGGRETEAFVRKLLKEEEIKDIVVVQVNESGASVYSASDVARDEFPDLDLTVRGAISIGRRLQDPLAELVKIDPKSIGVGQYQHDVFQGLMQRKLGEVVESCVNHVGVELNTASAPLLSRVAGIGPALARRIVEHRDNGKPFTCRQQLRDVSGMGPSRFEQSAGFLRIRDGENPLDNSAVHPERYDLVARIAQDLKVELADLVGNAALARSINIDKYVDETVGEPTLRDIVEELQKPGRDPRATFEPPKFRDDVTELSQLQEGMTFEGVVTNVTNFGAFVDIGVHQDGLVHISQLADRFVKDPNEVVKVGDRLKVRVLEVDVPRKRISLTARQGKAQQSAGPRSGGRGRGGNKPRQPQGGRGGAKFSNNPFANLGKLRDS